MQDERHELDAAVRRAVPVRDEQVAAAWDTDPAKHALLAAITGAPARRVRSRVTGRLTVLLAATLVLAAIGARRWPAACSPPTRRTSASSSSRARPRPTSTCPGGGRS
jgi:hypothetical protein